MEEAAAEDMLMPGPGEVGDILPGENWANIIEPQVVCTQFLYM